MVRHGLKNEKSVRNLLWPAVIEHAESDVFMVHSITQSDPDNRCDLNAISLCLLDKFDLPLPSTYIVDS